MDTDFESVLLVIRECFGKFLSHKNALLSLPIICFSQLNVRSHLRPQSTRFLHVLPPEVIGNEGPAWASEWGDLGSSYLWKGRLRLMSKGQACFIRLEDNETGMSDMNGWYGAVDNVVLIIYLLHLGEVFAVSPYDPNSNSVEAVLDSSRYFVLKIENEGRHAFIGMGFQERSDAFDFNVALQDFTKQINAEKQSEQRAKEVDSTPKKDYSLKEGQTINISIGNVGKRSRNRSTENNAQSGGMVPLIPPPPSASQVKQQQQQQHNQLNLF
ncbi:hypothetical protein [Absidia glauca]|uniref:NECAP PHear domain-containing protein n=1 Tax=Absidia glauca TaxID=4829 RepID=A0A163KSZ0_ABSGL|nr:hypothetical protein [Absidia glauca]